MTANITLTGNEELIGDVECNNIAAGSHVKILSGNLTVHKIEDNVTLELIGTGFSYELAQKNPALLSKLIVHLFTVTGEIGKNVRIFAFGHYVMNLTTVGEGCTILSEMGAISVNEVKNSSAITTTGGIQCKHLFPNGKLTTRSGIIYVTQADEFSDMTALRGKVKVKKAHPKANIEYSNIEVTETAPNYRYSRIVSCISLFSRFEGTILDLPKRLYEEPAPAPTIPLTTSSSSDCVLRLR